MARRFVPLPLLTAFALAACGGPGDGAVKVAFIDSPAEMTSGGNRLSAGAQHLRAATSVGLVALDAQGEVVPALANRWIVTDDGLSFIFRLREGEWPDGRELTAESVRRALREAIRELAGTSLGLDLAPISDVRATAGRVVEIRLASPVPSLLQLLAQPELTLSRGESGPMALDWRGSVAVLTLRPPSERGLPEESDWQEFVRPVELQPVAAEQAIAMFDAGTVDLVLGGRLDSLPLAPTGPLSRGTVQLDPAIGLLGLQVRRANGLLETIQGREAIAMAIDRPALIAPFNIGGWVPTTRVVAPGLPDDLGLVPERWTDNPIADLRAEASRRVAGWRSSNGGEPPQVSLALPRAPGTDRLFRDLAFQLATIGVILQRVPEDEVADLVLVDRVARYAAPRWFLNQFHCSLRQGLCEPEADQLLAQALDEPDSAVRAMLLADAEARLTLSNLYIPIGSPLRWSLVRGNLTGFQPNAWAFHPLPALAQIAR
jgi:ABC-type transport system substrate-binding protein